MNLDKVTKTLAQADRELARAQKAAKTARDRASKRYAALAKAPTKARYVAYCKAAQSESEANCRAAYGELQLLAAVKAAGKKAKTTRRKKARKKAPNGITKKAASAQSKKKRSKKAKKSK